MNDELLVDRVPTTQELVMPRGLQIPILVNKPDEEIMFHRSMEECCLAAIFVREVFLSDVSFFDELSDVLQNIMV